MSCVLGGMFLKLLPKDRDHVIGLWCEWLSPVALSSEKKSGDTLFLCLLGSRFSFGLVVIPLTPKSGYVVLTQSKVRHSCC